MVDQLTETEKQLLLRLARDSMESAVRGHTPPALAESLLTPLLLADGASFVTLTIRGELRGCIGALQAYQPLHQDVREHAIAAALQDYRFPPVRPGELQSIHIEVSRLTAPEALAYRNAEDLLGKLRPSIDGVILKDGARRATFLPQVWAQIPSRDAFLSHLCAKMGAASNLWREKHLDVQVYQVEEFHESRSTVKP